MYKAISGITVAQYLAGRERLRQQSAILREQPPEVWQYKPVVPGLATRGGYALARCESPTMALVALTAAQQWAQRGEVYHEAATGAYIASIPDDLTYQTKHALAQAARRAIEQGTPPADPLTLLVSLEHSAHPEDAQRRDRQQAKSRAFVQHYGAPGVTLLSEDIPYLTANSSSNQCREDLLRVLFSFVQVKPDVLAYDTGYTLEETQQELDRLVAEGLVLESDGTYALTETLQEISH